MESQIVKNVKSLKVIAFPMVFCCFLLCVCFCEFYFLCFKIVSLCFHAQICITTTQKKNNKNKNKNKKDYLRQNFIIDLLAVIPFLLYVIDSVQGKSDKSIAESTGFIKLYRFLRFFWFFVLFSSWKCIFFVCFCMCWLVGFIFEKKKNLGQKNKATKFKMK